MSPIRLKPPKAGAGAAARRGPDLTGTLVPPRGPQRAEVMLVGEAPGRGEAEARRPFVGKSGQAQEDYLRRHRLSTAAWRVTNLVGEFREGNPDPTPEQIAVWGPVLEQEIATCRPKLIVAVGRYSAQWFLGFKAQMRNVHGVPFLSPKAPGAVVVAVTHPATGFYSPDSRGVIAWDYAQVARTLQRLQSGERAEMVAVADWLDGAEEYVDVSGEEFARLMDGVRMGAVVAIDTEGYEESPWSLQVCIEQEGVAYMLRREREDFNAGAEALQRAVDRGILLVMHNAMHDPSVLRAMGVEVGRSLNTEWFDTMYAAYLLRVEPQGLKALAWRWCGMKMDQYDSIVASGVEVKQLEYLAMVMAEGEPPAKPPRPVRPRVEKFARGTHKAVRLAARERYKEAVEAWKSDVIDWKCEVLRDLYKYGRWGRPAVRYETDNAGVTKPRQLTGLYARVKALLNDYALSGLNEAGDEDGASDEKGASRVDLAARWKAIDPEVRKPAEEALGMFPETTLSDVDLGVVLRYAARDADATYRLYLKLKAKLEAIGKMELMRRGMATLPVLEEMQATGMMASRSSFQSLTDEIEVKMEELQGRISNEWFSSRPFNPMSGDHVSTLMRRRGLQGEKTTSTGKVSTAKKSIEHLRYEDEAIAAVIEWREMAKIRDGFCLPALRRMPTPEQSADDLHPITCEIYPTRVETRRLAARNPNLLQMPTRHELGRRVRDCYQAPDGQLFGSWDLSTIEIRYLAHESQDPVLLGLLRNGKCEGCGAFHEGVRSGVCGECGGEIKERNFHSETAAAIFNIPLDQVHKKKHREPAKRCSFGIAYGTTGAGLYDQFRMMEGMDLDYWSVERCDELIANWLNVHQGAAAYFKRCAQEARRTGYVEDYWGMRRYIPGIWANEPHIRSEAERVSVNHRIQGGAQGMIQNSIAWLRPRIAEMQRSGKKVWWCLTVHDEIILRFEEGLEEELNALVVEGLTKHYDLPGFSVPVESSGAWAKTWGGLK